MLRFAWLVRLASYVWAFPWTLMGAACGLLAVCTGGGMMWRGSVMEFHGGAATWLLARLVNGERIAAITLGHTILGKTPCDLERCRDHEMVHVRQYERWGPFFIPAYLLCSAYLWCAGKDPYLDNFFEIEAFRES